MGHDQKITNGLENISIEISRTEMQRQKKAKKYGNEYSRNLGKS